MGGRLKANNSRWNHRDPHFTPHFHTRPHLQQDLHDRQPKRERLSGTRLRSANDVLPVTDGRRQTLFLNVGWLAEALWREWGSVTQGGRSECGVDLVQQSVGSAMPFLLLPSECKQCKNTLE